MSYNSPSPALTPQLGKGLSMSPTFPITTPPQSHYQVPLLLKTSYTTNHIRQTQNYQQASNENNIYNFPKNTSIAQHQGQGYLQEGIYNTPTPPRPPKPIEAFGPLLDVSGGDQDSIYNTPRNYSTSSSSSASSRAYEISNSRIKDSAISPKHSSIIGTIADDRNRTPPIATPPMSRSAISISASSSPLATPELKRLNISNR